jgi:hypothetical protein
MRLGHKIRVRNRSKDGPQTIGCLYEFLKEYSLVLSTLNNSLIKFD